MDAFELIKDKTMEGWETSIECKGESREYALTFEALSTQKSNQPDDLFGWKNSHFAVGETFGECVSHLFGEPVSQDLEDEHLRARMKGNWNIDLGFSKNEKGEIEIKGHAKDLGDLSSEDPWRYASAPTIDKLMEVLFISYDPENEYAQTFRRQLEHRAN